MRVGFRFSKTGNLVYISHLDLQRTMHRAIKRAALPVRYSQGFHALPLVNFALALGVGCTSVGEYMEAILEDGYDYRQALGLLNAVLPAGLAMTAVFPIDEKSPSLMAMVAAALWQVHAPQITQPMLDKLCMQKQIIVQRTTKRGIKPTDIAPGILSARAMPGGAELFLAAGSVLNVRPGEVLETLGADPRAPIHRKELFAVKDHTYLPLMKFIEGELF